LRWFCLLLLPFIFLIYWLWIFVVMIGTLYPLILSGRMRGFKVVLKINSLRCGSGGSGTRFGIIKG
jgi:hypothetical protein